MTSAWVAARPKAHFRMEYPTIFFQIQARLPHILPIRLRILPFILKSDTNMYYL